MSNAVLEPILRSPLMVEHLEELTRFAAIEAQRRRKFYEEITEDAKWEFINGEVVMHSPASSQHNRIVGRLYKLLSIWVDARELGQVTVEKTLCQFPRNDYEPDSVFFGVVKAARIQPETLPHPVPDMVVEVLSPSTAKVDRGIKLQDYQAHGVSEYWIIDPVAETLECYVLVNGTYRLTGPLSDGMIAAKAIAGFEISLRAIFDNKANVETAHRLFGNI
jgi:Uma2 family endonuclease